MADRTIAVNADALHQVLQALIGPGHHIRELQFTRNLHKLGHPNAIETLIDDYTRAAAPKVEREGLTDARIQEIWVEHGLDEDAPEAFARRIEAAHGIGSSTDGGGK